MGRIRHLNLFRVSLAVCGVVAVWGVVSPDALATSAGAITTAAFHSLDWFFMLTVTACLVLCLWLGLGRYRGVRLGRPEDRPEFSTASWLAMLFAAGMGVGLLFWGVAEPISHFGSPPLGQGGTARAARDALMLTDFHWGLHAWAVYCVAALVIAYFGFRRQEPHLPSTPIRAILRGRWVEPVAAGADLLAVLAVVFGVAGSAGTGVLQLQAGLHVVAGIPEDSVVWAMGILAALVAAYVTSAVTSLDKGIKWLSNANMALAVLLMAFVLLSGSTAWLLRSFVTSVADYASHIVGLSLRTFPYDAEGSDWLQSWTLTNFVWWIAWAPFVGIFIARISRGRTIGEFVLGVLLVPTVFSLLWFAIFGGTALHEEMLGAGGIVAAVHADVTSALFVLFDRFPAPGLLAGLAVALVFVFLVTSLDSATFVLGMLTSRGSTTPTTRRKLAWGVALGVLSAALVLSGNVRAVRAVAILGALPFTFILLLQIAGLLRALRADHEPAGDDPDAEPATADPGPSEEEPA